MTLYLPYRPTDNCPTQAVTHTAPLWTCGCRQSSRHGLCSHYHKSQQKATKISLPMAMPLPPSTTCCLQQPTTASGTGPQHRAGWRPQFPAGGERWGQGEKGKGSPSLPSPTPVRRRGGLNPSLTSNGIGLLPCTATLFKVTHSDFTQVKFFISKPTDTAGVCGEGRLSAHRPGKLRHFEWNTSECPGATEPTWPPLPQAWSPEAVSQHTRCAPQLPGRWALPDTSGEAWASRPWGSACSELAPGSRRCRKQSASIRLLFPRPNQ